MQWITLIIGAFFGYMIDDSFLSVFSCAILGAFIGLNIRVSQLTKAQQQLLVKLQHLEKARQGIRPVEISPLMPFVELVKEEVKEEIKPQEVVEQVISYVSPLELPQASKPVALSVEPAIAMPSATVEPRPEPTGYIEQVGAVKSIQYKVDDSRNSALVVFDVVRNWLLGGNLILKVGAIILFLGLAFLLRYATEGMSFPVEGRYIGIALGGVILTIIGWRLRNEKQGYGLILQGLGVAVLYLTSYATMYVHHLLPPTTVFIFLLVFTVLATLLAIFQDAISLACAAALGGFVAPILVSSGGGSHIVFFSYLLLLNIGILSVAWFKAWRPLNLIGFIGTFGMGFTWAIKSYNPSLFWSTEFFLITFFILYIVIGLLFVRRRLYEQKHLPESRQALLRLSIKQANYLDATIIFGTPIVCFGLQYALIQDVEYGAAASALLLGIFYLIQAFLFYQFGSKRIMLLTETNLALGVIFTTLAIPLAFNVEWISASWALEGAGIFWISLKQQRKVGILFSAFLQCAAGISFISQLSPTGNTLLIGSSFGALLLTVSLLFSFLQLFKSDEIIVGQEKLLALLSIFGISFFYLLAPLNLMQQETAICWVFMGLITLMLSSRINYLILFSSGLVIQALALILFIVKIPFMSLGIGFNSNMHQFIICIIFAVLLLSNGIFFIHKQSAILTMHCLRMLNIFLLMGLIIIHVAPLFVLPWLWVASIWAVMGCLISILNRQFNNITIFYFSLTLPILAVITFVINNGLSHQITTIVNINFVTLLIISISTLMMAWHINQTYIIGFAKESLQNISKLCLMASVVCWSFAFIIEINALVATPYQEVVFLLILTVTLLIAGILANYYQWQELALIQLLLIPMAFVLLNQLFFDPLSHFGWFAWSCLLAVHFYNLKRLNGLIPMKGLLFCHMTGLWLIIILLSCVLSKLFKVIGLVDMTWSWLVWMIAPCLWLLLLCYYSKWSWPIKEFKKVYYYMGSLPVAIYLFTWYWLANICSTGAISAIPYISIVNPLEIGLLVALFASVNWLKQNQAFFPIQWPRYFIKGLVGVSLFVMSTMLVFRMAFNWLGVSFNFEEQIHSMIVQACLSILWTVAALWLMVRGHQKSYRELWVIGASLIVLVVVKLFFIELRDSGSLARIASFTIVGFLLLIVGYFAPLPPKVKKECAE